jgi:murein DD-endopeptidase MepM/ murein hydrolase activator NlpD
MGGKLNEKIFLMLILISTVFFLNTCARHKVPVERPSPPHGMKGVYHVVERHQTLYRICKTYGVDLKGVASLNGIPDPSKIETGQRIFIPGAKKVLKVEIYIDDVAAEQGEKSPIKASNAGKVIYSHNGIKGYGNLIILRHSEEYVTVYAHNQANLVDEGTWAEKGQIIGRVGQTGRATGPHLHFEIRKNTKPVDPFLFLK